VDVRLILKLGNGRRQTFRLSGEQSVIGRARGCAVRIPSADVSRTHCRIVSRDGFVTVEDLGSLNGTRLNGAAVDTAVEIRPGDVLAVGPVQFVVEYEVEIVASSADFEIVPDESGSDVVLADDVVADEELVTVAEDPPELPAHLEPVDDDSPLPMGELDLDNASSWRPPEGSDLRDILAEVEQSDDSNPSRKKKK
jgi:predicted component of type VI protein secretion system